MASWSAEWWLWALIMATGLLYLHGLLRLWRTARRGAGIAVWQASAFGGGWLLLVAALLSPLDTLGASLFSAHMVQHELLMLGAAPLLVLGKPLGAFLWGLPPRARPRAWALCHSSGLQAAVHRVSAPLEAWLLHAAALWIWHVPALFDAALRSDAVHIAQHLSFFGTALLFWWSLLRPDPTRATRGLGVLAVLTTAVHSGLLGALLTFAGSPWYRPYAGTTLAFGLSPLEDQQLGGLVMWVPAGGVYLLAAVLLFAAWLRSPAPIRHGSATRSTA